MRFPPIPPTEWTAEQRAVAEQIIEGPRGQLRGPFIPLMHSPGLAARVQQLGAYLRFDTAIPRDLIEIAILLTARHYDCGYIWQSHRPQALAAGVAQDIVTAIAARRSPVDLAPPQAVLVGLCGELLERNQVAATTFELAVQQWGAKGAMDLAGLVGYYGLLAMVLNVSATPQTGGGDPFGG